MRPSGGMESAGARVLGQVEMTQRWRCQHLGFNNISSAFCPGENETNNKSSFRRLKKFEWKAGHGGARL